MKKGATLFLALSLLLILCFAFTSCESTVSEKIELQTYKVVIPLEATTTEEYCAENFVLALEERLGVKLEIIRDDMPQTEKEILIGNTKREESNTRDVEMGKYQLFLIDSKIVIKGSGVYIGGGAGALLNYHLEKTDEGIFLKNMPTTDKNRTFYFESKAQDVVFMIGDGMGHNHIKMAEWDSLDHFVAQDFPRVGEVITQSQSVIDGEAEYTDSSASATAMSTGTKTLNGYIGIDKNKGKLLNIRELAHLSGAKTGVLTTDALTGATPCGYLCHLDSRYDDEALFAQIQDLIENRQVDFLAGEVDNELTDKAKEALHSFTGADSFFLMIEEAHIDKASHEKNMRRAINSVIRYNDVIEYVAQFTFMHPETMLVVTADHETGGITGSDEVDFYAFTTSNHTNANVPYFALGAGVDYIPYEIDNTYFFDLCKSAFED